MFWDNYKKLCDENNIAPTAAGIAVGVTNAAVSKWKKGTIPNGMTLQKIADYFGVSVAHLMGEDEAVLHEEAEQNAEAILRLTESAEESVMQMLLLKLPDISPEQIDTLRNLFRLPPNEFKRSMDMLDLMWKK